MNKIQMNSKGMFITLSVFFIATMLFAANASLNTSSTINNSAELNLIAGQRTAFVKNNFIDVIRLIYSSSNITWSKEDNVFTYSVILPNQSLEEVQDNLIEFKAYMFQEYPDNNLHTDYLYLNPFPISGKDFNVVHSTLGQSDNHEITFDSTTNNFESINFDINVASSTVDVVSDNYSLCSGCAEPIALTINIYNDTNTLVYSFDNDIDYTKNSSARFDTTGSGNDLSFSYTGHTNDFVWDETTTPAVVTTKITFYDSNYLLDAVDTMLEIHEMIDFGFEG